MLRSAPALREVIIPVFLEAFICVVLLQSFEVQSELICSHQPIVALVGEDVILPCYLAPAMDADLWTVMWAKPDLDPKYVHFHQDGRLMFEHQNPSYHLRTRLFVDELPKGNVSMKIFKVKMSDAGKYFCILPSIRAKASIQLIVGAVSTPNIEIVSNGNREAVLQCESKGWYPEPEVSWLDGEGHILSAGPTETSRGSDGLYDVSSRVTVNMMTYSDSKSFTCGVKQKNINQTRETQIHVPADLFKALSLLHPTTIILIIIIGVFVPVCGALVCIPILNNKRDTRSMEEVGWTAEENLKNRRDKNTPTKTVQKQNEHYRLLESQRATGEDSDSGSTYVHVNM